MPQLKEYANPNELLQDPKFQSLSDDAKQGVMVRLFPRFRSLSPEAQGKILLPKASLEPLPSHRPPPPNFPLLSAHANEGPLLNEPPASSVETLRGLGPKTPSGALGQITGATVEMAEPGIRGLFDQFRSVQSGETSPISPLTPLRGGINALEAITAPVFGPAMAMADNIITNIVVSAGPSKVGQFSPGPIGAETAPNPLLRGPDPELVKSNLANIGNIAGPEENRPTTNFPPADSFIALLTAFIPFETALIARSRLIAKKFRQKELDVEDADNLKSYFVDPENPESGVSQMELFVDSIDDTPPPLDPIPHINPIEQSREALGGIKKGFRSMLRPLSGGLVALRRTGESGRDLARRVDVINNIGEIDAGNDIADLRKLGRLFSKEEKNSLWRSLDLGEAPINNKVRNAFTAVRSRLDAMGESIKQSGLRVRRKDGTIGDFVLRENYYPRYLDRKAILKDEDKLAKHLVDTKQASTEREGRIALRAFVDHHTTPRVGNIEFAREVDLPSKYYNTDPFTALSTYFSRGHRRIQEAIHYGPNDEIMEQLLVRIAKESGEGVYAGRLMSRIRGTEVIDPLAQNVSLTLRALNTPMLAAAQMINLSQSAATALRTNALVTVRAIAETLVIRPGKSREFSLRAGATLDATLREIGEQIGGAFSRTYLDYTGFSFTERINRTISAVAGKHYADWVFSKAQKTGRKAFKDELRGLGIDPNVALANSKLTDQDYFRAAQTVTNQSQFRARPGDLPLWATSPAGKVAFQFKQFAFNQTKLVNDQLIKQWATNPELALRSAVSATASYKVGGLIFGRGRQEIRKAVAEQLTGTELVFPDNPDPELVKSIMDGSKAVGSPLGIDEAKLLASWYQDVTTAGSIGLMRDAFLHSQFGDRSAAGFFFGPSTELLFVVGDLTQGETGSLKRAAIRRSGVGPFVSGPTK